MIFTSTFSAAALLVLASQLASATTLSTKFLTSTSQSGSGGPDSSESYFPNSMVCGIGTTCDSAVSALTISHSSSTDLEGKHPTPPSHLSRIPSPETNTPGTQCGSGFSDCSGSDGYQGCYNQTAGATCCSNGSSCDAGWYCYAGDTSQSICCPDGLDEDGCAQKLLDAGDTATATAASSGGGAGSISASAASPTATGVGDGNATTSSGSSSLGIGAPGAGWGGMLGMLCIVAAGAVFL